MYEEHLNVTDKETYAKFKSCLTHQTGNSDKNYTQPLLVGGFLWVEGRLNLPFWKFKKFMSFVLITSLLEIYPIEIKAPI